MPRSKKKKRRQLLDAVIQEVSGVDRAANDRKFLLVKRADDIIKTKGGKSHTMTWEELIAKIEDEELRKQLEEKLETRKAWEDTVEQEKAELVKKIEELEKVDEDTEDDISEMPEELQKRFEDMQKRIDAAEQMAKAERLAREKVEFLKRAEEYKAVAEVEKVADLLQKAFEFDDEFGAALEEVIKSATARISEGDLFVSKGSDNADSPKTAYEVALEKAQKLVQEDSKLSVEKAVMNVLQGDPGLYNQYLEEQRALGRD